MFPPRHPHALMGNEPVHWGENIHRPLLLDLRLATGDVAPESGRTRWEPRQSLIFLPLNFQTMEILPKFYVGSRLIGGFWEIYTLEFCEGIPIIQAKVSSKRCSTAKHK